MVGARAYNYIKPLQIASLLGVGANAHPYNSEVGASLHCINFGRATDLVGGSAHCSISDVWAQELGKMRFMRIRHQIEKDI